MGALLHAWVLFPALLGVAAYGLGLLVERLSGVKLTGALLIPVGVAALIVVAGLATSWDTTVSLASPAVAVLALAGLVLGGRSRRLDPWPALAALGVLLAYGAPVLLSGEATFNGYIKLDDTASWLAFTDQVMADGRSLESLAPSTYQLLLDTHVTKGYPVGAFLPLGVGTALAGMDSAWLIQPYLAACGALLALCAYALLTPLVASARLRALAAFVAAQPALLYGYSLWGGIKELTLAFLLLLVVAVATELLPRRTGRRRDLLPLAVVGAALTIVIGPGAIVWLGPLFAVLAFAWLRPRADRPGLVRLAWLGGLTLALALPVVRILGTMLEYENQHRTFEESDLANRFGNLTEPLSALQLGGIWPVEDFRLSPDTLPTALLLAVVAGSAAWALWWSVRNRRPGVPIYVGLALLACAAGALSGATPWVRAKTLAIASPGLLLAAMLGASLLWSRTRAVGGIVLALLAGGVLWSNVLAHRDATLAPRDRMAELEHIGELVAGKGPTFDNQYEVYSSRHFLRDGAPVQPAEYRQATLALTTGAVLTKAAYADLDAFPLTALLPYRSIVVGAWPGSSRPPSIYELIFEGRYYRLYQLPLTPKRAVVEHIPLGDATELAYCGAAQGGEKRPLCPVSSTAVPRCADIRRIARRARSLGLQLVANRRPQPIVARGDQMQWPGVWSHNESEHTLTATAPGTAVARIAVAVTQPYKLWLGGSFGRGFEIAVDGRRIGRVKNQLGTIGQYVPVADVALTSGVHEFTFTYPGDDLGPGNLDSLGSRLTTIALEPAGQRSQLITANPRSAEGLCLQPLDWIELVTG